MKSLACLLLVLLGMTSPALAEPLSLQQCLELTRQHNPELTAARLAPQIAARRVEEAQSGYLPSLDVSGGYTLLKDAQAVVIGGTTEPTQEDRFPFADLTLEQTLYDFGRTGSRVNEAKALASASDQELRDTTQALLLQTVVTYFRLLEAQQLLEAADQEELLVTDHLRVAQALFDQGVVTRNDVLQAEVELAGSHQRRLTGANRLENAWLQLNYLTGRAPEARGELQSEHLDAPTTPDAEQLPRLLAEHPLIQAEMQRVAAGEAALAGTRSAYLPKLYAQGKIDYLSNRYVEQQTMYAATVGIKFNLFDGLAKQARRAAARSRVQQETERLQALAKQAALVYRVAQNDSQVAATRIASAREAVRQAEENLRINRDRYQSQVGTASEVLEAQTLLTSSRSELFQAEYDYQIALARQQRALGLLGEQP